MVAQVGRNDQKLIGQTFGNCLPVVGKTEQAVQDQDRTALSEFAVKEFHFFFECRNDRFLTPLNYVCLPDGKRSVIIKFWLPAFERPEHVEIFVCSPAMKINMLVKDQSDGSPAHRWFSMFPF